MLKRRSFAQSLLMCFAAFGMALLLMSVTVLTGNESLTVYADDLEDDLSGSESDTSGDGYEGNVSQDDLDVGDWISGQRGMTGEQLQVASETLSPLTNAIGYITGGIVTLIFVGLFLITALDLLYITVPPVRNILYKAGTDGTGAYTGGMPGGGYGYGRHSMMGMGGMAGMGGAAGGTAKPTQWISDEAVMCAALMGGSAQAQQPGMMGGMGMGGMYGGMQQQQAQQQISMKSVIGTYFKKRIFFMILLVLSAIILTSSVLLGTGVNLANWIIKMVDMLNSYIPV